MKRTAQMAFLVCVSFAIGKNIEAQHVEKELIPPSRTLQGAQQAAQWGNITVVSEPPGLAVTLDGKKLGETPIRSLRFLEGQHQLVIAGKEQEVLLSSTAPLIVSYFKGRYIVQYQEPKAKEPEQEELEQPEPEPAVDTAADESSQDEDKLSNWELFNNGTQRHF